MARSIHTLVLTTLLLAVYGCNTAPADAEKIKSEIAATERAFARMAAEKGIDKAFLSYAAEDAILIRNSQAVEGRASIEKYFSEQPDEGQSLSWTPRKIEVAASGELAYSFGDFAFTRIDDMGDEQILHGNYCTIWKRQPDGSWKFVVD